MFGPFGGRESIYSQTLRERDILHVIERNVFIHRLKLFEPKKPTGRLGRFLRQSRRKDFNYSSKLTLRLLRSLRRRENSPQFTRALAFSNRWGRGVLRRF